MGPSDEACYTDAKMEATCLGAWGAQISRWLSFSGYRGRTHLITTAYRLPREERRTWQEHRRQAGLC